MNSTPEEQRREAGAAEEAGEPPKDEKHARRTQFSGGCDGSILCLWSIAVSCAKTQQRTVIATSTSKVATSAAWRARLSPMALRPDLAIGLPLSIC